MKFISFSWLFGGFVFPDVVWTFENIALNKSAWQQNTDGALNFNASLAVDGRKSNLSIFGGECAVSKYGKTAEWRVDLGSVLSINHIFIQYTANKDDYKNRFFLGFSVYISNSTSKEDGIMCFRDTNYTRASIPNPANITCPYHGRYVIYFNNRTHPPYPEGYSEFAYSDLCEVEVYGCPLSGYYGENCSKQCPRHCLENRCQIVDGTCFGCMMDYTGSFCEEKCPVGLYGNDCQKNCSINCIVPGKCDRVTGQCEGGCHAGWKRPMCNEYCPVGLFGTDCLGNCSKHCINPGGCNRLTGKCVEGCQAGWKGNNCDKKCDGGTYGSGCNQSCGKCLDKEQCHYVNGSCLNGCDRGYQGTNCVESCGRGFHGYSCNSTCSFQFSSSSGTCHHITGTCLSLFPTGEQHPCDVGRQQENLSKNRYKTILPYDHSRVILNGDDGSSDYINASYINDNKRDNAYIATQGPKDNTVKDFWRMVWQENVTQIVMLTNLKEGGKNKCTRYWPNCMSREFYEHITIENVVEKCCAFFITRKFNLWQKQESRVVMQYHFTGWPDHGTPDPLELVVFHGHVLRTRCKDDRTPFIVHCSAGVGRTGTYIALDALYKEGKITGKINVAEYVKVMRSCRMNMVQTNEQYIAIFIALNEEFKATVEVQSLTNFVENVDSFIKFPEKQTVVREEFEKLLQIRPEYTSDDYQEAGHYPLNTKGTVLPLDKYLLYLTSPVRNRGRYINAIHVSSYLQENDFIVTQYPTLEDTVDFLRLLTDHETVAVICMDPLSEIESSTTWLPGSASVKAVPPFSVQHVGEMDTNVRVTNLRILGRKGLSHPVVIVEPRGIIKPGGSQQDTSSLLSLVSYALSISTEGPITIVSRDGASLCGVFCAVFNSVQQINMENNVNVFTTVRQLQTRRLEFCSNLDEYWLVNRALRDYIGTTSENVYCNV